MRVNENHFDEMQRQKRDKIGRQSFHLLLYALLMEIWLYKRVEWLEHPVSTMVIIMAVGGIYMVRLILAGAYAPGRESVKKLVVWKVIAFAAAALLAFAVVYFFGVPEAESAEGGMSAVILVIVSLVTLSAAGIAGFSRTLARRKGEDDD